MPSSSFSSMFGASKKYADKKNEKKTITPIRYSDYTFGVDGNYINTFAKDADDFFSKSNDTFANSGYSDTSRHYEEFKNNSSSLNNRARMIRAYRDSHKDKLDEKTLSSIDSVLSAWDEGNNSFTTAYEDKISMLSKFVSDEDYQKAVRTSELSSKYANSTRDERDKALNDLEVKRAEEGKLVGEDRDLDEEIDYLKYYGAREGYKTSAEYDEEIPALWNKIEFGGSEYGKRTEEGKALRDYIGTLERDRNNLRAEENAFAPYQEYLDSADYEKLSKYSGDGKGVYKYINSDPVTQEQMRAEEKGQQFTQNSDSAAMFMTSKYGNYDLLTDKEKGMYNYLYASGSGKAAQFLTDLSPVLAQRRNEELATTAKKIGKTSPISSSVISLGTNLAAAASGLTSIMTTTADTVTGGKGVAIPELDMASAITSGYRAGAGEKAGEALDVDIPVLQKKAGEFVYDSLMSMADMGVAIGLGAALGGGTAAVTGKVTQFIMSSEAAANAVYSAHEEGLSGIEAAARGVLAGAIEAITEKYSIENLLGNPKGIIKGALSQAFIEGTEEGASTLLNTVADGIVSEISGHANELERATYDLIKEGMTPEEASKEALTQLLRDFGTDVLAGALTGAVMGGAKEIPSAIANAVDKRAEAKETKVDITKISEATAKQLESLGETGDIDLISRAIAKQAAGKKLTKSESAAISESKYAAEISRQLTPEVIEKGGEDTKWATEIGTTKVNPQQYSSNVKRDGKYTVAPKDNGGYDISITTRDGSAESIDINDIDVAAPESRIVKLGEKQHMTPATVQTLLNSYDGKTNVVDYVEEAEYVYAMGKTGVPKSQVSRGLGLLSTTAKEMLYEDGAAYAAEEVRKVSESYRTLTERTSGVITAGTFDTSAIKGLALTKAQTRNIRVAKALSDLGFNIKVVRDVSGNAKASGSYNPNSNVIEVNINASSKGLDSSIRSQARSNFVGTLAHEIDHQFEVSSPAEYAEYSRVVLSAFEASGNLEGMLTREVERLRDTGRYNDKSEGEILDLARRELVARASENMLQDSDAIKRVIEENRTVGEKIVDIITKFVEKLRSLLNDIKGDRSLREEAVLLEEMVDYYEEAKEKWAKAFVATVKNVAAVNEAGTKVDGSGDVMYSEGDVEITMDDVETLRSIRSVSINKLTSEEIKKAEPWARKFFRELGVKSPFFRAWFGDWREFDEQSKRRVTDLMPVEIRNKQDAVNIINEGLKNKTLFRGDIVNTDLKNVNSDGIINIGRQVYNDTLTYSSRAYSRDNDLISFADRISLLLNIREITQNAILFDTEIAKDNKIPNQAFMHKLYSLAKIGRTNYLVKLSVDELISNANSIKRAYNVNTIEISPIAVSRDLSPAGTMDDNGDLISAYSVADLFSLVKQYDQNFKPKPSSKVVNADGTPKVMYHGSPNEFTVFDKKRSKGSNLYGRGFYFSDSNAHAGVYGKLYEVYLDVKNPLSPNVTKISKTQIKNFLEAVAENEDYSIENYGTYDADEILEKITSRDAFDVIQDINATAVGDFAEAIELFNEVNGTKFDGIITPTETVVFSPTQIKSATDNIGTFDGTNPNIRYSEETSPRESIADALGGVTMTDAEKAVIEDYRAKAKKLDALEAELKSVGREIKEMSFTKGKRDTAKLAELKGRKAVLEEEIQRADRKLLELEGTKMLKDVLLRREKQLRDRKNAAVKQAKADAKAMSDKKLTEALAESRSAVRKAKEGERLAAEAEIAEIKRKALEREYERRRRDVRNTVKERAKNLVSYISNQSDKKNVKEGIKGAALEFLRVILNESGMFTPSEMRNLKKAYAMLNKENANTDLEFKGAYTFEIMEDIEALEDTVAGRPWRDLTLDELAKVNEVTANLRTMIRTENKIFREGRAEERVALAEAFRSKAESSKTKRAKGKLDKFLVTDNMTPVYFFKRIGGVLESIFKDVVAAQNKATAQYNKAAIKLAELKKKYNFKKWYKNKATTITTEAGAKFKITAGQAMYIYAVDKREKNLDFETNHLREGGIVTEDVVKQGKKENRTDEQIEQERIPLTEKDLSTIFATLTDEQKAMADDMVKYLSEDMSVLGNEVSMRHFGIKKYKETYYIPFKVSSMFRHKSILDDFGNNGAPTTKLKDMSGSHGLQKGANQPLVVTDIFDVWSEHVVEMSNYYAFVTPIEAIENILNFRYEDGSTGEYVLKQAYGENALSYLKTFARDLNGGAVALDKTLVESLVSLNKKAKVAASLSVVIQQYWAIIRAAAEIDPKYLMAAKSVKTDSEGAKLKLWERMKRYAPGVTVTKEMGRFDTGSGMSAREFINPDSRAKNLAEAANQTLGKLDDMLGKPAEWADMLAWMQIWKAVEAEVKAKTNLRGEAFYEAVGERFTEVINKTQVYDSVLSKSAHMRSKNPIAVAMTAFKAEPTLTLNLLADAIRSKDAKRIARVGTVYVVQTIVNVALVSLVYAGRDDDDEKTYAEKYVAALSGKLVDEFTMLGNIPFISDIASLAKGYDTDRMELTLIKSVFKASQELLKEDVDAEAWIDFGASLSDLFGIPAKNIIRDAMAVVNTITSTPLKETDKESIEYSVREEFANSVTDKLLRKAFGVSFDPAYAGGMFDALDEGDYAKAREIRDGIYEYKLFEKEREAMAKGDEFDRKEAEENARTALQTKLTNHYKPLYLAAYEAKDYAEMERIKGLLRRADVYKKNVSEVCSGWVNDSK